MPRKPNDKPAMTHAERQAAYRERRSAASQDALQRLARIIEAPNHMQGLITEVIRWIDTHHFLAAPRGEEAYSVVGAQQLVAYLEQLSASLVPQNDLTIIHDD